MNIYEMTRKDFENLEETQTYDELECDSIIILPIKKRIEDDSQFAIFSAILCKDNEPIAKLRSFDIFSFFSRRNVVRSIDILYKPMLIRIKLTDYFKANQFYHSINTLKEDHNDRIRNRNK